MYLEKFKDKDVVIITNIIPNNSKDFKTSDYYGLSKIAEFLGAKSIVLNGDTKGKYVIRYYSKDNPIVDDCKILIDVFYDDLNKAYALEQIYKKGELIGYFEKVKGKKRAIIPNEILREESFLYFDIKLSNYDFTVKGE